MARNCLATIAAASHAAVRFHLERLYLMTRHHPGRVLAGSLLLLALSLASIASIRFESDIFRLFPADRGALGLFTDTLRWTGGGSTAYFILEGERDTLPGEAARLADRLSALKIDGTHAFSSVRYRLFDPAEAESLSAFVSYAVLHPGLFLAPDQVPAYAAVFSPQELAGRLERSKAELASAVGSPSLAAADPFALRDQVLPRLKAGAEALDLDPESPYFLSRDGKVLVMMAEAARPVTDMEFARKLVAGINRARQGFSSRISCAGAHLSAVIDEAVMKRNISGCILSSLAVILILFYSTYRRFLPTLLIPVILLFGVAVALGTAGLFLRSVHIVSFAFMALIIGLGTDYSIHLYDRFHSERAAGGHLEEALRLAVVDTGHGLFTAATTTALPFLALMLTDIRALFELGLLVGLGVIFSLYATFLFLPPLLRLTERNRMHYPPLPTFGLGRLWRISRRHRGAVAIATAAALLLSVFWTTRLGFEGELKNLQPRHSEALLTQEKIEKHLSLSPKQLVVAVEGSDPEELLVREARVANLAETYRARKLISSWSGPSSFLNPAPVQREIGAQLSRELPPSPEEAARHALRTAGFAPEEFRSFLDGAARLKDERTVPVADGLKALAASPLRGVVERHLVHDAKGWHALVYLNYRGGEFPVDRFLADLKVADPRARVTGQDLVSVQLIESVRKTFLFAAFAGGILVLFLLLSHFDGTAGLFPSLFPVAAGTAAMLGGMAVSGMRLNFMNVTVLVTIVGMGSDYGMHIFHRIRQPREAERQAGFVQAGRAVLLSALTTIAGFGSLAFADYGALASIGWATNYGIAATALFALAVIPIAVRTNDR